ncbi:MULTISPECIES: CsxC family protein [Clostridium]|uniref:CsxC family protein n=1 Tax=Clostridium TaxID=1485 RepID=UPI00082541DB|nr:MULTISPECIES: hypothetical protein [Clostridium]
MDNNQGCEVSDPICSAAVIRPTTLEQAENFPVRPGKYKLPVVLSEFVIQIDVEAKVRLNFPSYEIKRIEKQVFLTQCRYIGGTDKVFIAGYIRKNIEYASRNCTTRSGISGVINDQVVHVPFKCVTRVFFNGARPRVTPNFQPDVTRYFDKRRMGKNIREADRASYERFNEPVYCELEWSKIFDADIDDRGSSVDSLPNEEEFREFTDKSVVYIKIKLLQNQQVWDHSKHYEKHECKHDKKDDKKYDEEDYGEYDEEYGGGYDEEYDLKDDEKDENNTKSKFYNYNNYKWHGIPDYYTRK